MFTLTFSTICLLKITDGSIEEKNFAETFSRKIPLWRRSAENFLSYLIQYIRTILLN